MYKKNYSDAKSDLFALISERSELEYSARPEVLYLFIYLFKNVSVYFSAINSQIMWWNICKLVPAFPSPAFPNG